MINLLQTRHRTYHCRLEEYSSILRTGLEWDRRHRTRNGRSALPADVASEIRTLSTFTQEERADLRVGRAGYAIMPERSFDICFLILYQGDVVDGGFDLLEVLRVLVNDRAVLDKVSMQQQQTISAISIWSRGG